MKFSSFLIFTLLLSFSSSFAQNKYYKILGRSTLDEIQFIQFEKDLTAENKTELLRIRTIEKKDSIINIMKVEFITLMPDGFDPYGAAKKQIGKNLILRILKIPKESILKIFCLKVSRRSLISGLPSARLV